MTLEELLAAMNEAKAKAEASPEDAALKAAYEAAETAYNEAKAEADAGDDDDDDDSGEPDESKLDDRTKKYIEKLRKENAKHRVAAKDLKSKLTMSEAQKKKMLEAAGIKLEEEDPEEKLKSSEAEKGDLQFKLAVSEMAIEHGISKADKKYFEFLVQEALDGLKEDEDLDDTKIAEIAKEARKRSGVKGNTSIGGGAGDKEGGKGGSNPPPPDKGGKGQPTLNDFAKMNVIERSVLYQKNPTLYNQLVAEAKKHNRLI